MLMNEFGRNFPEYVETEAKVDHKLIPNSFNTDASEVTEEIRKELIKFQNDRNCKDAFESETLEKLLDLRIAFLHQVKRQFHTPK
ncbi:unnamed protein product [Arctia plantaginis]|uniref:Uncharacterized protein n=1 Tax=Arctia plantaginis TaxID=874455 RepID=A0A8S0ZVA5_ARCPL|nr:unnamed protein product [Arctia plantaginis]